MGYHFDVLYDNDGHYQNNLDAQVKNTLTVIFTFSDSMILKWRGKLLYETEKGKKVWVEDKTWNTNISMNDYSITVINTIDECPRFVSYLRSKIKYQHGVDNIKTECFSISYIFMTVKTHMDYCNETNILMNNDSSPFDNHSFKLIVDFDKHEYHKNLVNYYISKFELFSI